MFLEKDPETFRRAVKNHVNVIIAGFPGIVEQLRAIALKQTGGPVTQVIQGSTQRAAPFLVPASAAGVAAAIAAPPFYAMGATPGRIVNDLDFVRRRKLFQNLSI